MLVTSEQPQQLLLSMARLLLWQSYLTKIDDPLQLSRQDHHELLPLETVHLFSCRHHAAGTVQSQRLVCACAPITELVRQPQLLPGATCSLCEQFPMCSDDESSDPVEDEHHVIVECSGYGYARELFLDIFQGHISTASHLMNQPQCNRVAKFRTWIRMLRMNQA